MLNVTGVHFTYSGHDTCYLSLTLNDTCIRGIKRPLDDVRRALLRTAGVRQVVADFRTTNIRAVVSVTLTDGTKLLNLALYENERGRLVLAIPPDRRSGSGRPASPYRHRDECADIERAVIALLGRLLHRDAGGDDDDPQTALLPF